MKKMMTILLASAFLIACSGSGDGESKSAAKDPAAKPKKEIKVKKPKSVSSSDEPIQLAEDGEVLAVKLNEPLVASMVDKGKSIYNMKCASCHKLSGLRVVGPGWEKITERRDPAWIMNMTVNIEMMLEKDPIAKDLLKECLVRMPNQNLSLEDARSVLEFMYSNDGKAVGS